MSFTVNIWECPPFSIFSIFFSTGFTMFHTKVRKNLDDNLGVEHLWQFHYEIGLGIVFERYFFWCRPEIGQHIRRWLKISGTKLASVKPPSQGCEETSLLSVPQFRRDSPWTSAYALPGWLVPAKDCGLGNMPKLEGFEPSDNLKWVVGWCFNWICRSVLAAGIHVACIMWYLCGLHLH